MQINTREELLAASKAIDAYHKREAEKRIAKAEHHRAQLLALVGDLGGDMRLVAWAIARHEAEKENGIGRGMTQAEGVNWHLKQLARSVRDVCDAFGIEPATIKDTRP